MILTSFWRCWRDTRASPAQMLKGPMSDDLTSDGLPTHGEPIDPVAMARRDMNKALPKRFYKEARPRRATAASPFASTADR